MPVRKEADDFVRFLNSLSQIDPKLMGHFVETKVRANKAMSTHPTVLKVSDHPHKTELNFLSIINGFLGTIDEGPKKGKGPIVAVVEPDGSVNNFLKIE